MFHCTYTFDCSIYKSSTLHVTYRSVADYEHIFCTVSLQFHADSVLLVKINAQTWNAESTTVALCLEKERTNTKVKFTFRIFYPKVMYMIIIIHIN